MRLILTSAAALSLLGLVAVPAVAGLKAQPSADVAGIGTVTFRDLDNGNVHTSASMATMSAKGPGNFSFQTVGRVSSSFNPVLSQWEFDFGAPPGGRVDVQHAMDNSRIEVTQSSQTYDMYTNAGGCGEIEAVGSGTMRVRRWVRTGVIASPMKRSFRSRGASCL